MTMYDEREEYEHARRLLAPLADQEAGPSRVDLQRAIVAGRRRQRTRQLVGVSAIAAVTALAVAGIPTALVAAWEPDDPTLASTPPPAATASPTASPAPVGPTPPTGCELARLPEPDGAYQSLVTGADPTGRFILGRTYFRDEPGVRPVIWDDGELVTVDVPGYDPSLVDANSSGVAVATSFEQPDGPNRQQAWVYRDGQLSRLAGENVSVSAINEQGMAVGAGYRSEIDGTPLVWRSLSADPEELPVPAGEWDIATTDVDSDGTVIGHGIDIAEIPDPPEHSYVWLPDGTRQELPRPDIDGEPAFDFAAESIHDGVVTGRAKQLLDGGNGWTFHVFRYDLATGEFTPLTTPVSMGVEVWNRQGWFAGNTGDGLVLVTGSGTVSLPYPQGPENPDDPFADDPIVAAISDDGRIVGGQIWADTGDPETVDAEAVSWRCQ
jgi:hypothetical protein